MFIYVLVPLSVSVMLPLILLLIKRNNTLKESQMIETNFIMREHKGMIIICFLATILFYSLVIILNILGGVDIFVNIIFLPILLFCPFGCYGVIKEKIVINNYQIEWYPILGKVKKFSFYDIKKVEIISYTNGVEKYKLFGQDKKLLVFSNTMIGYNLFMNIVYKLGISVITINK